MEAKWDSKVCQVVSMEACNDYVIVELMDDEHARWDQCLHDLGGAIFSSPKNYPNFDLEPSGMHVRVCLLSNREAWSLTITYNFEGWL